MSILLAEFEDMLAHTYPEPPTGKQLFDLRAAFMGGALVALEHPENAGLLAGELLQYLRTVETAAKLSEYQRKVQ